MKDITIKLLTTVISLTTVLGFLLINPQAMFAATTAHVQIVGSEKTIWYGDVSTDGCMVTDTTNVSHTYAQPFAVCALDVAAKIGGFTYQVKDFGGSLGLFLQSIAGDTGAADFSTYWSYDINGQAAQNGISSQLISNGDNLKFFFVDPNADVNQRAINDAITYLRSQQASDGSIQGYTGVTPWAVMAFASANVDPSTVTMNGHSLLDYLSANPPTDSATVTDWEKAILAITAVNQNPYNFGGVNYEAKLETYYNNGQIGNTTLLNDDVFGLLALIASGDSASSSIKQSVTQFLVTHQLSDGSFTYSTTGTTGDVDDTASTLQALVAAQNQNVSVTGLSDAITKATTYLVNAQRSNGGFPYSLTDTDPNSSSTAWASIALTAVGGNDSAIAKAKTFLQSNQEENGSFHWQPSSSGETFTTSYVVPALEGKSWPLQIFSGTVTLTPTPSPTASVTPSPTVTPTSSPTPTATVTPTVTPSPTMSPTPTITVSPTPGKGGNKDVKKHQQEVLALIHKQQKAIEEEMQRLEEQNRVIYARINAECSRLIHSMDRFFKI